MRRGFLRLPSSASRRRCLRLPAGVSLLLLLATGAAGQAPARAGALEIEAARVDRGNTLCMVHHGRPLPPGTAILLVQPDTPQSVARALPGPGNCQPWSDPGAALLPLRVLGGTLDSARLSIAIVGAAGAPVARNGIVAVDLDGDGTPERFRACTSSEGIHLTIWSGRRLRWHGYFYLGYDVEPSCSEPETREPAPAAALGRRPAAG